MEDDLKDRPTKTEIAEMLRFMAKDKNETRSAPWYKTDDVYYRFQFLHWAADALAESKEDL